MTHEENEIHDLALLKRYGVQELTVEVMEAELDALEAELKTRGNVLSSKLESRIDHLRLKLSAQ